MTDLPGLERGVFTAGAEELGQQVDAVLHVLEGADSRPNDAVSKRGMDAMLARLEACQEQLKAEKAEREQAAMSMQEAPLPEELMMAQQTMMPQQMPQDAMMEQGAPMMAAYGGRVNTFGPGGWLNGLLSRYKENHVPENFQAYENDPYMYGEIEPALNIGSTAFEVEDVTLDVAVDDVAELCLLTVVIRSVILANGVLDVVKRRFLVECQCLLPCLFFLLARTTFLLFVK